MIDIKAISINNKLLNTLNAITEIKTEYEYNAIGTMIGKKVYDINNPQDILSELNMTYSSSNQLKELRKLFTGEPEYTLGNPQSITYNLDSLVYGYRYSYSGANEQKRLLYSPHGDSSYIDDDVTFHNPHLWEYSLLGAGGNELVHYKGIQTSAEINGDSGRRVYMSAHRYMISGTELQYRSDGRLELHLTDHVGSVRAIIESDGAGAYNSDWQKIDYRPFGEQSWTATDGVVRHGFGGDIFDIESGFIRMGARMYEPETGRFTSVDPLFEAFKRWSPYSYSYNSPLTFRDPTGLAPEKEKYKDEILDFPDVYKEFFDVRQIMLQSIEDNVIFENLKNDMIKLITSLDHTMHIVQLLNALDDLEKAMEKARTGEAGSANNVSYNKETGNIEVETPEGTLEIHLEINDKPWYRSRSGMIRQTIRNIQRMYDAAPDAFVNILKDGISTRIVIDRQSNILFNGNPVPGLHSYNPLDNSSTISIGKQYYSLAYSIKLGTNMYLGEGGKKYSENLLYILSHEFGHRADLAQRGVSSFRSTEYEQWLFRERKAYEFTNKVFRESKRPLLDIEEILLIREQRR